MVEIKRKSGESIESLLRRFTRRLQQSKVLIQAKDSRYYKKPKTKRAQKEDAIRRMGIRSKKDYLRRIGKLTEEDTRRSIKR
ncbi:30S ribosomal protein S21 [Patescibacteria group bacterium]|nr:30S ribosomal protein S21 [Patescibacteria group bacterium]MBU4511865.1 30S ribosomal protein S21 [Patescibacteria group bacterium]